MKVNIERDVDVNQLLINLNCKSQCKSVGMAGYEVTIDKQTLRDARDVIAQFMKEKDHEQKDLLKNKNRKYVIGDIFYFNELVRCNRRLCLNGASFITAVNENTYTIKDLNDNEYIVFEDDLDSADMIIKNNIRENK